MIHNLPLPTMEETDAEIDSTFSNTDGEVSEELPRRCSTCKQVSSIQYKRNMETLKQKILFTDNLIAMYTQSKSQKNELVHEIKVLEQKCKDKDEENKLIQKQLKSLLNNDDPSEIEMLKAKVLDLETIVDNLNDQLKSMDMTCKMYEDKIHEMKEADATKESERKSFHHEREQLSKEIKSLNKTIRALERENLNLKKKNESVHERLRRRRSSRSSQATDSEANMSFLSEDATKTENDDIADKPFKSPLPDKKKRLKRKRRISEVAEPSDDDPDTAVAHISKVNDAEDIMSPIMETEENQISSETAPDRRREFSASDQLSASTPKLIISSSMKDHMREMKAKRAFRIFAHRPTSNQFKEMKLLVERIQSDITLVEGEIHAFCEKQVLIGHEAHVARKIIKHYREQLENTVIEKLKGLTNKREASSTGETDNESSFEQGKNKNTEKEKLTSRNGLENTTASVLSTSQPTFTQTVENTAIESISVMDIGISDQKPELVEHILTKKQENLLENFVGATTENKHIRNTEESTSIQQLVKSTRVNSKDSGEPSGMFSSDDEITSEHFSPPCDHVTKTTKVKTSEFRRVRTRSMSKSISEGSDSGLSLEKIASQAEILLSPLQDFTSAVSSSEEEKPAHDNDGEATISVRRVKRKKSNTPQVKSVDSSNTKLKKPERSTQQKNRLMKRTKPNLRDISDVGSEISPTKKKVARLESEKHVAIIKSNTEKRVLDDKTSQNSNSRGSSTSGKPLQKVKIQSKDKTFTRRHPMLSSMHSLPFKVGSDSPRTVSPKYNDFNFLPVLSQDIEESDSESNESESDISVSVHQLDAIFADMIPMPLSPLKDEPCSSKSVASEHSFDPEDSVNKVSGSDASSDEDDGRSSISPSANLCTAIVFDKERKGKLKKTTSTPEKSKTLQRISNIRETPRRFSCEAPRAACSVPLVKPVAKTKSYDPSLLVGSDALKSFSAQHENKTVPSTQDGKEVNQTLSHNSSGPFKVVSQNTVADAEQSTIFLASTSTDENNDKTETPLEVNNLGKTAVAEGSLLNADRKPIVIAKANITIPVRNRIMFKPLAVTLSKQKQTAKNTNSSDVQPNKAGDSLSIEDALNEIENDKKVHTDSVVASVGPDQNKTRKKNKPFNQNFEHVFQTKHHETLESILDSVQDVADADAISGFFKPVSSLKVLSWISGLLTHTRRHSTNEGVEKYLNSRTSYGDPSLETILHPNEFLFVKLLAAVDEIRSTNSAGFLKTTVVPTLLKTLCRYGFGFDAKQESLQETQSYLVLSRVFENGAFSHYDTNSLTRIYAAICRCCGNAKAMIDLSKYVLLCKSPLVRARIILELFSCWPTVLTQLYPATGRIIVVMLNSRLRPNLRNQRMAIPITNFTALLYWNAEPKVLNWKPSQRVNPSVEAKWKTTALKKCIENMKNAQVVPHIELEKPVYRLAVENHDDIYQALEMFCLMEGINVVAAELIDTEFWPLLNNWSQHYTLSQQNIPTDRKVSDECVVAVLKALAICLLALLSKQKKYHPTQGLHCQALTYFETICSMVQIFKNDPAAPVMVQCAAVATLLTLSLCKPCVAYDAVQSWLIATSDFDDSSCKTSSSKQSRRHRHEPLLSAFYHGSNLRKNVSWLEREHNKLAENKSGRSITHLLWG